MDDVGWRVMLITEFWENAPQGVVAPEKKVKKSWKETTRTNADDD